jgi:hypothetical protein
VGGLAFRMELEAENALVTRCKFAFSRLAEENRFWLEVQVVGGAHAITTLLLANNEEERNVVGMNLLVCKKIVGSDDLCGNAAFGVYGSTSMDNTVFALVLPKGWHLVIVLA